MGLVIYDRGTHVDVRFTETVAYRGTVSLATFKLDGDEIRSAGLQTLPLTHEETSREFEALVHEWGFARKDFDAWLTQSDMDPGRCDAFETMRNDLNPSFSMRITPGFLRPPTWIIGLSVYWDKEAPLHPSTDPAVPK